VSPGDREVLADRGADDTGLVPAGGRDRLDEPELRFGVEVLRVGRVPLVLGRDRRRLAGLGDGDRVEVEPAHVAAEVAVAVVVVQFDRDLVVAGRQFDLGREHLPVVPVVRERRLDRPRLAVDAQSRPRRAGVFHPLCVLLGVARVPEVEVVAPGRGDTADPEGD